MSEPVSPDPRSWEPDDVKIDPITKARPTNADVLHVVDQVHACLEDHKVQTADGFKAVEHRIALNHAESRKVRAEMKADIDKLKDAWGVGETPKRVAATSTPWQAFRRTAYATTTSIVTVAVLWKVGVILAPAVMLAITGLIAAAGKGLL